MRPLNLLSQTCLALAGLVTATASTSTSGSSNSLTTTAGTTVTFRIAATHQLPNPFALPPSTHATLTAQGRRPGLAALSPLNTFEFRNVTPGSYLVDVHCATHAFAPLRLDVLLQVGGDSSTGNEEAGVVLQAWETFRGNNWDNRGQAVAMQEGGVFELQAVGPKNYFMERSKFSVLGVFKNPMILLGLVSMALVFGMPYLVDSMDPEMRAEFEERQKSSPMNSLMGSVGGGGGGGSGSSGGNFDMAAFLAGSSSKDEGSSSNNGGASRKNR